MSAWAAFKASSGDVWPARALLTFLEIAWLTWGYTGETGRALACSTACLSSVENGSAFLTSGSSYVALSAGGSEYSAARRFWFSSRVR